MQQAMIKILRKQIQRRILRYEPRDLRPEENSYLVRARGRNVPKRDLPALQRHQADNGFPQWGVPEPVACRSIRQPSDLPIFDLQLYLERRDSTNSIHSSALGSCKDSDVAWMRAQEAADMVDQAQQDKEEAEQEAEKAQRQMELDVDEEIEQLKSKCVSMVMALLKNSSLPCTPVLSLLGSSDLSGSVFCAASKLDGGMHS